MNSSNERYEELCNGNRQCGADLRIVVENSTIECLRLEKRLIQGFPCVYFSTAAVNGFFGPGAEFSENRLKN